MAIGVQSSAESEALCKHSGELTYLLRDVEWLATELYSSSMITFETFDDVVTTVGVSCMQKVRRLLCALQRSLAGLSQSDQAGYFRKFLAILKKEQTLHWLANRIEATYKSHFITSEQLSVPLPNPVIEPIKCGALEAQYTCHFLQSTTNIAKYASYLKSLYASRNMPICQKWPPTPSKTYVNLALITKDDASLTEAYELTTAKLHGHIDRILKKKLPIRMHQLLGTTGSQKCVLIEGNPGVGKSTFVWELCRNWETLPMLYNFSLILLIQLRERQVQEASAFVDLLYHRNASLKQATAVDVENIDGDNMLFIFDGFDELPADKRQNGSLFLDIINGLYLPKATIIITSRPSVTAELLTRCKPQITRHVEILGFTECDIWEYVSSVLQDPEQVDRFHEYIMSNPLIYSIMYVPLNCVIIVELYKQSQHQKIPLPQTMTELYDRLTRTLIRRYLVENKFVSDEFQMPGDLRFLPGGALQQFLELCDIAFNGICKQKLTWDDLPNNFNHLGFMTKWSNVLIEKGPEIHFNFIHLTVQEFAAAVHISYQPAHQQSEMYELYGHLHHFQVVWRFVAGLTKFCSLRWSNVLLKNQVKSPEWLKVDYCIQLPALHCLYEAQDHSICENFCGSSDNVGFLPDIASPFDCLVLSFCVSYTVCSWTIDLISAAVDHQGIKSLVSGLRARPYSVRELRLGSNQMGLLGVSHLSMIPSFIMETLCVLKLYNCSLSSAAFDRLADLLISFPCLKELDLGANSAGEGGMVKLMYSLQHLKNLKLLDIADVAVGSADFCALETLLKCITLKTLKVGDRRMTVDTTTDLLQIVFHPSTLECIDLRNLDLTAISDVFESLLQANYNIKILILTWCRLGSVVAGSVAKALLLNNSLLSLKIKHPILGIQVDGCEALSTMLRTNTTLCELELLDDSVETGAQNIVNVALNSRTLTKFQISQCKH